MTSRVIIDGDMLEIDKTFGNRKVTITGDAKISGSGHAKICGKKICVLGDEKKVRLQATYSIDGYTSPGNGLVTIAVLHDSQLSQGCISNAALILEGEGSFSALFTPLVPAIGPPPANVVDVTTPTAGAGRFKHSQDWVRA